MLLDIAATGRQGFRIASYCWRCLCSWWLWPWTPVGCIAPCKRTRNCCAITIQDRPSCQAHGKAAADGERDRYEAVEDSLSGGATPLDYLEKIFQIPFWLSPMPVTARKNMVKGLLEQSLVKPTPTVQEGRLGAGVAPSTSGATPGSTTTRGDGAGAVTPTKQAAGQDASGDGAPGQASPTR